MTDIENVAAAANAEAGFGHTAELRGEYAKACEHYRKAIVLLEARTITVSQAAQVLLDATPNPVFDQLKPTLMGEHSVSLPEFDEDDEEYTRQINVPWVVQKDIIFDALRALITSQPQGEET